MNSTWPEFNEQHICHHTYQLKEERAYRIVIRYLHHSTNLDDIKQELAELGHTIRNIINVRHKLTKEPLNLFFVDLEPAQNNKKIYEVTDIQNRTVKIEPPHSSKTNITQCMRCQQYGHTKSYYKKPIVCVRSPDHQFGFRRAVSTVQQTHRIITTINTALNNK
jgi:hypothetical protein